MEQLTTKEKIELILKREETTGDGIEISLRDIIETVIKGKWIILGALFAAIILAYAGMKLTSPYQAKAQIMISYNYDGVDKGLDPYGKKLDVSKIKAPVITEEVVKKLKLDKLGVDSTDISDNISIEPVIPGNITEQLKEQEEAKKENIKDLEEIIYYPNKYIVQFNVIRGKGLSEKMGQEILSEVMKEYEKYFYETYSDRSVLANAIGELNYDEYDYPEVSLVMSSQISIMKNYLAAKNKEASDFRSKKTGLSFADISAAVDIIDQVDLNRMDSIIGAFNLTKDKEKLIKNLEYRIEKNSTLAAKKQDEAAIASSMLDKFQKDKSMVYLPGLTGTDAAGAGTIELEKGGEYYDALAERSTDSGVASRNIAHDSEYIKKIIARFQNDTVSPEFKAKALKDVVVLMKNVKEKLEKWVGLTNETVAEYYETELYNKAVRELSPVEMVPPVEQSKLILAIGAVIGLMIGLFTAFFMEYWRRSGKIVAER